MRLVVGLDGANVEFVSPTADGEYPWLGNVGTLLLAARAGHLEGHGAGETANLRVTIDNTDRQAARLLQRPLRAPATVYDDAGDVFFEGLIENVEYAPDKTMTLGIEG